MSEIYEDGDTGYIPDLIKEVWIGILSEEENEIIGCYRIQRRTSVLWHIHALILPKYRGKIAKGASYSALKYAFDNISKINSIFCTIALYHRNVILHAMQAGLRKTGLIPKAYVKNGRVWDVQILTITEKQFRKVEESHGKCS